jgi:hypothetical protein
LCLPTPLVRKKYLGIILLFRNRIDKIHLLVFCFQFLCKLGKRITKLSA